MDTRSDLELLGDYVRTGAQDAFSALVFRVVEQQQNIERLDRILDSAPPLQWGCCSSPVARPSCGLTFYAEVEVIRWSRAAVAGNSLRCFSKPN